MHTTVNLSDISRYVSRSKPVEHSHSTSTAQCTPVGKETKKALENKNRTCKQIKTLVQVLQENILNKVWGIVIHRKSKMSKIIFMPCGLTSC